MFSINCQEECCTSRHPLEIKAERVTSRQVAIFRNNPREEEWQTDEKQEEKSNPEYIL